MTIIKRALISVSDKTGIIELAKSLEAAGVEIISTGGTAQKISQAGLQVTKVSELTGYPEMLDGSVKTLHPVIQAGLLALRKNPEHQAELKKYDIKTIDLVIANLYPFAETIAQAGVSRAEAMENIDIGGPTMIRAAAKNHQDVAVVVDPTDYNDLATKVKAGEALSAEFKRRLAYKAFRHTADYDFIIQEYLSENIEQEQSFPETFLINYEKKMDLRYGENPHQKAAFYQEKGKKESSITTAVQLAGKELSFNNINDANAALEIIKDFPDRPAAVVMKHANPCGLAEGDNLREAFLRAHAGDPLSAFGSIIAFNREVDENTAREMVADNKFIEVVIATSFHNQALDILKKRWRNIRLLEIADLFEKPGKAKYNFKKVAGGLLVQSKDLANIDVFDLEVVTDRRPSPEELADLLFAWKTVKHVKSNAIVMAKEKMLIGVGAGQMSRVDAMEIASHKAGIRAEGGVVASDAFFPFPDAIEKAAQAGIKAIVQPGGSIRDDQVIAACDESGISMVFTGIRHFKH